MKCEYCQTEHDGKYGSGRFCSKECARGFSTREKRDDINKSLMVHKPCRVCGKVPQERVGNGRFCSEECRLNYQTQRKQVSLKIRNSRAKERKLPVKKVNVSRASVDESMPFHLLSTVNKRKRLVKKFESKCSCCGLSEWNQQPIKLELHHINGNHSDDREENLTLLCPNCHSQTGNYKFTNKKHNGTKIADTELTIALLNSGSIRKALQDVGLEPRGDNYRRCYKLAALNGIKVS